VILEGAVAMSTAAPAAHAAPRVFGDGRQLPPLDDARLVADWLSAITGEPVADVRRQLLAECSLVGRNVRDSARAFGLAPHIWNERLLQFYGHTNAFLFETAAWNATRMKQTMREFVCRALASRLPSGARVLCYGDGMGFDSAALSALGFQVVCYEVSGPCLDFARRIFEHNRLDARIITDETQFGPGSFDAVVCLDVLEHVPDPPAVVGKFAGWLTQDGLLAAHAPFYHVDDTRPTHLKSNRRYAGVVRGLYGLSGFRVLDAGGPLLNPLVMQKTTAANPLPAATGTRLRVGLGQGITYAAKLLPGVPGLVASLICKPHAQWRDQLEQALQTPARAA